jgi:hypothetical protein
LVEKFSFLTCLIGAAVAACWILFHVLNDLVDNNNTRALSKNLLTISP